MQKFIKVTYSGLDANYKPYTETRFICAEKVVEAYIRTKESGEQEAVIFISDDVFFSTSNPAEICDIAHILNTLEINKE